MKRIGRSINLFFLRHRDKGIPNLMMYIALGNAVVMIISMINGGYALYDLLCFDKARILQGQVWRLVSYVFTQSTGSYLELIFLYFFYMLGRNVEARMGTLKFNLYYLSGVIMMDIFAMIFSPMYPTELYMSTAYYLHLSLLLTFATTYPEARFMIFFILPIKAWVLALIYMIMVLVNVINLPFPHCLFPLVALGNYLLFVGSDIKNLLPASLRARFIKKKQQKPPIVFTQHETGPYIVNKPQTYTHRCTVCGRTDVSHPELEFRYCSRCQGYHCYCNDHIHNHQHIE